MPSERRKRTIRSRLPKRTIPKTTYLQKISHRTETLYNQTGKRAEGCPEGAWLWRAGARLSMPPLVASFRYFLSIQEIPPPEVPGDDDKQCRQNVERERSGASPRKALALKRRTRPVVAFTPKHCTSRKESVPREVQRGLWLWRAGARLSMPPLVASFGYFLSTQEIPPPEAPSCDDKQCCQNVKRERFGASSKTPSQSPAGQFTFCTSKKIHLRLQSLCRKSPKGFSDSLKRTLRFSARSFCYRLVRRGRGAGRDFPGRSP